MRPKSASVMLKPSPNLKALLLLLPSLLFLFSYQSGSQYASANQSQVAAVPQANTQLLQPPNHSNLIIPTSNVPQSIAVNPLLQATLGIPPNFVPNDRPIIGQTARPQPPQPRRPKAVDLKPTASPSYQNEDPIIYVDYASINDEVLRKPTANFVYFNANFNSCRNCHKFFSNWKDLAVDIRWWRQVIRLFAINCSDEDNIDTCRKAGVTQFPQVKYYWIMSNDLDQDGQRLRILGKSVHAMRHLIMDKVLESYAEHNKMLAQKTKLQSHGGAAGLVAGGAGGNPLLSLMGPLMSLMGGSSGGGASATGSNPLSAIMSLISGNKSGGTNSVAGFGGLISSLGGMQGVTQLINTLTSATSMRHQMSVQALPRNWPEFEQIEVSDTQQLLDMLPLDPNKNIGALLIMETQEFLYIGPEVMLDLNPYSNQTYIARVRDDRGQMSKNLTKRDDIQAPALIYITETRQPKLILTASKYTNDEDLRRAFVRAFERRQVKYPVKRVWSMQTNANQIAARTGGNSTESQENEEILSKLNNVYMDDLTNALRSSLMEQVFRHPDLSDDQYNALVKYVYTLINYFPFHSDEQLKFFKRLHGWLQNQVSPMDVGEYKKQFHDIEDVMPKREWIACKSMSNSKAIPTRNRRPGLFENPAQFGKAVSNITRMLRNHQQQASKLKNLFNVFTSNLSQNQKLGAKSSAQNSLKTTIDSNNSTSSQQQATSTTKAPSSSTKSESSSSSTGGDESPIERIIKSLTSGSLGSDSSILKLISTALTGTSSGDSTKTGKSKFAREYPCGAWKLAHVMVVSEYVKDSPRKDVKHIVLHSMYQYMLHFYACSTCGNRVSDVSGEFKIHLDQNLLDQSDSVMLVWKFHNRVNKRLESEWRPGSPVKLQFPSESLCPKCRLARTQNDLGSTPNWLEKQVLNFLVHHYRPQSLIVGSNAASDSSATSILALIWQDPTQSLILVACLLLSRFIISHHS